MEITSEVAKERKPLRTAWKINDEFNLDGFFSMLAEGVQRIGKSSYVAQSMASAYGKWEWHDKVPFCYEPNFEVIKPWIVFPPKDFLKVVLNTYEKQRALSWDDAGFWLFALDWYDPFVKSVSKYIQLAGRQFGALLLTTPDQTLISQKVLMAMPNMFVCKIERFAGLRDTYWKRPRIAKVYQRWNYPDGKRGGVRRRWKDGFNAILPQTYYEWYQPISNQYLQVGLRILKQEVSRIEKRMGEFDADQQAEDVAKVTGGEERLKELTELIGQLEGAKKEKKDIDGEPQPEPKKEEKK